MSIEWHPVGVGWAVASAVALIVATVWTLRRLAHAYVGRGSAAVAVLRVAAILIVVGYLFRPCAQVALPGSSRRDVVFLWDGSRSMQLPTGGHGSASRLETALAWWDEADRAAKDLAGVVVHHFAFAETTRSIQSPSELAELEPGESTDIGSALQAVSRAVPRRAAVVLVSDGCHNRGVSPVSLVRNVGTRVDVVALWPGEGATDLRIDDVAAARVVYPGDTLMVRALIRWERLPRNQRVLVRLVEGGVVLDSSGFTATEGWGEDEVLLQSAFDRPGPRLLEVTASGPPEAGAGENAQWLNVEVVPATRVVGLLATAPHPDYAFLRRVLKRDRSLELCGGVLDAEGALVPGGGSVDVLARADLLIVLRASGTRLPDGFCSSIAGWVRAGAKGLLWLGTSLPRCGDLASLFPVRAFEDSVILGRACPMGSHVGHPLLHGTAVRWDMLPPLLVNGSARGLPGADVVLAVGDEATPLLLLAGRGGGRAGWVNSGSFWRWSLANSESREFAGMLVRRLVEWLSQRGGPLRLAFTQSGGVLIAEASLYDASWRPWAGGSVWLSLVDSLGASVSKVLLQEVPGASGCYRGRTARLKPGVYAYVAEAQVAGASVAMEAGRVHVASATLETAEPHVCFGLLRGIARTTGGRYYRPGEARQWIATLAERGRRLVVVCPWKQGWWAAAVLALLAVEWVVRRRIGLS